MAEVKRCPICHVENTGGKPHGWHKQSHRKSKHTLEQITEFSRATLELNQVKAIIGDAVDLARQPDNWQSRPKRKIRKLISLGR